MNKLLVGATPYYLQIEAILRDQIATGDLRPGDPVPTEKTLCEQYEVSRPTVRQAIKNLENDDLVIRERGKGTRVTERPEEKILPLIDLQLADLVYATRAEDIVLARTGNCILPPAVRAEYENDEPLEVFYFVRVLFKDKIPYMATKVFLHGEIAEFMTEKDYVAENFLEVLSQRSGIKIIQSEQKIEAILAEPSMAFFLEISPGTPLLSIRRTSRDKNKKPIEHSHTLIRMDRGKLNLVLGKNSDQEKWQVL